VLLATPASSDYSTLFLRPCMNKNESSSNVSTDRHEMHAGNKVPLKERLVKLARMNYAEAAARYPLIAIGFVIYIIITMAVLLYDLEQGRIVLYDFETKKIAFKKMHGYGHSWIFFNALGWGILGIIGFSTLAIRGIRRRYFKIEPEKIIIGKRPQKGKIYVLWLKFAKWRRRISGNKRG